MGDKAMDLCLRWGFSKLTDSEVNLQVVLEGSVCHLESSRKKLSGLQRERGIHLHLSKAHVTALNTHARGVICVFVSLVILYCTSWPAMLAPVIVVRPSICLSVCPLRKVSGNNLTTRHKTQYLWLSVQARARRVSHRNSYRHEHYRQGRTTGNNILWPANKL